MDLMSGYQTEVGCLVGLVRKNLRKMEKCTEMRGEIIYTQFQKNREGGETKGKKKKMALNKPHKMGLSLEKLERNSCTPCVLYMLTEGLL